MTEPIKQEHGRMEPAELPPDFEAFFALHKGEFLRVAGSRLRSFYDADEALMEAAMVMYQQWPDILAHANPVTLALTIVNRKAIDFYRRSIRITSREQPCGELTYADLPTVDDLLDLRGHDHLDRALADLEERAPVRANCVRLRYLADLPLDEVADRLNITKGAAKTNVHLALKDLQALMDLPPCGEREILMLEHILRTQAQLLHEQFDNHDTDDFMRRLAARIAQESARANQAADNGGTPTPAPPSLPRPPAPSQPGHDARQATAPPRTPGRRTPRHHRPPVTVTDRSTGPATVFRHIRGLCEAVLQSEDIDTLNAFAEDYDQAGARTFACLLYLTNRRESASTGGASQLEPETLWPVHHLPQDVAADRCHAVLAEAAGQAGGRHPAASRAP
ncbi:RNA polymerase sigma factor [Streptomyces uncialis]|uniref:RNA polymerase sigma factor n=1 Tax=Streptomyces uncialis TaxID=1048205 RepID=UPI00382060C3